MELNQMGIFATVVDQGSFIRASKKLSMPKSTVSRQVGKLEEQIGARLLHRTTRHLKLTEIGKLYLIKEVASKLPNRQLIVILFIRSMGLCIIV